MKSKALSWCLGLLFAATTCFAQMYTVTDLGTLGGTSSEARGINSSGQVIGFSNITGDGAVHAFRTAPNRAINPATDDLGTLGGAYSFAYGINDAGQAVGLANTTGNPALHAFRTAPNSGIHPATDDLGTLGGAYRNAKGINSSGQVVGLSFITGNGATHAFRTAPNSPINPATDDLGTLGGSYSFGYGINDSGQAVGVAFLPDNIVVHAFRTAPNAPINPATDDLGTLGGNYTYAYRINAYGQAVGYSTITGNIAGHAYRTAPNSAIVPSDDLGTLGGRDSFSFGINSFGEVVGLAYITGNDDVHAFLYSNGLMHDLTKLIPSDSGCALVPGPPDQQYPGEARLDINNAGQIATNALCGGQFHGVLLTPIYKAFVQPPINARGTSVFSARRKVLPVKFTLTRYNMPTCTLLPAAIAVNRAAGGTLALVDENTYVTAADSGSSFRTTGCQYVYKLAASSLGVGTYRVDISINGIMVGHAVFALK